ncbi:MAG: NUDIX hydrolase [Pseudomonadota bacterium]
MIRRHGEPVVTGQKYRKRPGVYAILVHEREVLVTHQAEPIPEFQLPGGGIDPGENPLSALHREVLEETGYSISRPRRIGAYRRFTYMPEYDLWAEKLCHIYVAAPALRHGPPGEPGHTAVWMSAKVAAQQLASVGDRAFLTQALGPFSSP